MTRDDNYTLDDLDRDSAVLENNPEAARAILGSDDPVKALQEEAESYESGLNRNSPGAEDYMDELERSGL